MATPLCEKCQNIAKKILWSVFSPTWAELYPFFSYEDRFSVSVQIRENTDMILFIYRNIRIRGKPLFRHILRNTLLRWIFIMVWPESTSLSETLRNFANLLLLHPCSYSFTYLSNNSTICSAHSRISVFRSGIISIIFFTRKILTLLVLFSFQEVFIPNLNSYEVIGRSFYQSLNRFPHGRGKRFSMYQYRLCARFLVHRWMLVF